MRIDTATPQHSDGDGGEARAMRVGALPVATEQEDLLYFLAASARTLSLCSAHIAPSLTALRSKIFLLRSSFILLEKKWIATEDRDPSPPFTRTIETADWLDRCLDEEEYGGIDTVATTQIGIVNIRSRV